MKILFKAFLITLCSAVTAAITTYAYHRFLINKPITESIDYKDFVSISMTALGLMLTILGFFVAAASLIGWTTIESKLKDHSIQYFKEQLKEGSELRKKLDEIVSSVAYEGVRNLENLPDT